MDKNELHRHSGLTRDMNAANAVLSAFATLALVGLGVWIAWAVVMKAIH